MSRNRIPAELAEQIKEMWEAGLPASHIGAKIGKTRDSVLGLIRKMRKSGVAIERITKTFPLRQTAQIIIFPSKELGKNQTPLKNSKGGVRMADLRLLSCRYIDGEAMGYETIFCGKVTVQGSTYCEEHRRICYRPDPKSKRSSRPK